MAEGGNHNTNHRQDIQRHLPAGPSKYKVGDLFTYCSITKSITYNEPSRPTLLENDGLVKAGSCYTIYIFSEKEIARDGGSTSAQDEESFLNLCNRALSTISPTNDSTNNLNYKTTTSNLDQSLSGDAMIQIFYSYDDIQVPTAHDKLGHQPEELTNDQQLLPRKASIVSYHLQPQASVSADSSPNALQGTAEPGIHSLHGRKTKTKSERLHPFSPECGIVVATKGRLNQDILCHGAGKRYSCYLCNCSFSSNIKLREHCYLAHNIVTFNYQTTTSDLAQSLGGDAMSQNFYSCDEIQAEHRSVLTAHDELGLQPEELSTDQQLWTRKSDPISYDLHPQASISADSSPYALQGTAEPRIKSLHSRKTKNKSTRSHPFSPECGSRVATKGCHKKDILGAGKRYRCYICNCSFSSNIKLREHCYLAHNIVTSHYQTTTSDLTQSLGGDAMFKQFYSCDDIQDEHRLVPTAHHELGHQPEFSNDQLLPRKAGPLSNHLQLQASVSANSSPNALKGTAEPGIHSLHDREAKNKSERSHPFIPECGRRIATKGRLKQDILCHGAGKRYSCYICNCSFSSNIKLRRHVLLAHKIVCDISYSNKGHLTNHTKSYGGYQRFKCSKCDCSFTRKVNVDNHMLNAHRETIPGNNNILEHKPEEDLPSTSMLHPSSSTQAKVYFNKKTKNTCKSFRKFCCQLCGISYTNKGHLTNHMKYHGANKRYRCSLCNCSFTQKANIDKHNLHAHKASMPCNNYILAQEHNEDLLSTSTFQQRGSTQPNSLTPQPNSLTPQPNNLTLQPSSSTQAKVYFNKKTKNTCKSFRKVCCQLCGISFTNKGFLTNHMKCHGANKRYRCSLCNCSFTQKANIDKHNLHAHKASMPSNNYILAQEHNEDLPSTSTFQQRGSTPQSSFSTPKPSISTLEPSISTRPNSLTPQPNSLTPQPSSKTHQPGNSTLQLSSSVNTGDTWFVPQVFQEPMTLNIIPEHQQEEDFPMKDLNYYLPC